MAEAAKRGGARCHRGSQGPIFAGRGPRRRCAQPGANAHKRLQVYDPGADTGSAGLVRDGEQIRQTTDEAGWRCVLVRGRKRNDDGQSLATSERPSPERELLRRSKFVASKLDLSFSGLFLLFPSRLSRCTSLFSCSLPVSAGSPLVLLCLIQSCAPTTGQWGRNAGA